VSDFLRGHRLLAVIRRPGYDDVAEMVPSLLDGGVNAFEFTFTGAGAVAAAKAAKAVSSEVVAGVGTVRTVAELDEAAAAGLDFAVAPALDETIVLAARDRLPFVPGVLTPSEVVRAHQLGCSTVKLFPASIGGPSMVRDLRMLFPYVAVLPSGGIPVGAAAEYLAAGACAVSIGSDLVGSAGKPLEAAEVVRRARALRSAIDAVS
jgi:2-dehydro-3-deoxyphosphogluconate aldolase/(4S)-4-hydroxy-2-oxoglutarate aldolase